MSSEQGSVAPVHCVRFSLGMMACATRRATPLLCLCACDWLSRCVLYHTSEGSVEDHWFACKGGPLKADPVGFGRFVEGFVCLPDLTPRPLRIREYCVGSSFLSLVIWENVVEP